MRRTAFATSLVLLLGNALPAVAAAPATSRLAPAHRITAVTVYPDRALVTRTAALTLSPGHYEVMVGSLPVRLDQDSVRLGGRGTARVLMHGHDVRKVYVGEAPQAKVATLNEQMQKLRDQDRSLADRWKVQSQQKQLLDDLSKELAPNLARQLGAGKAKLPEWQQTVGFVYDRLQLTAAMMQQLEIQRRQVAEKIAAIEAQLRTVRSYRQTEVRQVPVMLEVTKGGSFALDLTYAMPGARWSPAHEARLSGDGKQLSWRSYGMVSQETGEDWKGVAMKLSTARPSAGGSAPVVRDWLLMPYMPPPPAPPSGYGSSAAPMRSSKMMDKPAMSPAPEAGAGPDEGEEDAGLQMATVVDQGTSVTLAIPGPVDVPSDGQPHQAPLGEFTTAAETEYRVVPRFDPAVYLAAKFKNSASWPLLIGTVRSYLDTTFVGASTVSQLVAPGQKLELGMGVDDAITVKRTRTKREAKDAGLLGGDRQWDYEYRIAVTNNKGTTQAITVVEPMPRSEASDIRIEPLQIVPAAGKSEGPNRLVWKLTVPAHTEKLVDWGYRVVHPKQMNVTGLE